MTVALNTGRQGSKKCLSSLFDKALFRNKHRSGVHSQRLKHQNLKKKSTKDAKFSKPNCRDKAIACTIRKKNSPIEYKTQNQTAVVETTKRGEKKTLTNSDSRKTE
jgi:hypothetical protein